MGAYGDQERGKTGVKRRAYFLDRDIRMYILEVGGKVMAGAKAQLVKWGNSQAVRIPKTILEQCNLREGEELEIRVENGHIWLEPSSQKPTLKALVEKITPENRHGERDWGKPVGNEVW
jgi:antitoxin MazE